MEGHRLIIDSPHLPNENDFKADKMALAWNFNLRKKEIYISADFDKPAWKLDSNQHFNEDKLKKVFKGKKGGLKYFFDLNVTNGKASWILPDKTEHQVYFDAKTSSKSGGCIKTYFDQTPDDQHYISISTSSTTDLLSIIWEFHEIECSHFFTFTKLFFPDLEKIRIISGMLKGKIHTNFPANQRPYISGEMQIENLSFIQDGSLYGDVEKALLKIEKNPFQGQPLSTLFQLDLPSPVYLKLYPTDGSVGEEQKIPVWEINDLVGAITLDGNKKALFQLNCDTLHQDKQSSFKLVGSINLDSKQEFQLNLLADCSSSFDPQGYIRLSIEQLNPPEKKAELEISNLSSAGASFLQCLFSPIIPSAKNIDLKQGSLNGFFELVLTKEGLNHLNIKHFNASKIAFQIDSIHAACTFDGMTGQGSIQLADPNPWDTLDLDLNLDQGAINLEGLDQILPLTDIQAQLSVNKGSLQHSLITLKWMGMKGVMDLEWGNGKELMTFNLDGYVHHISHLFPGRIQQAFNEDFGYSRLKILANLKRKDRQFDLTGTVHVQRNQSDQFDLIHFGCEFQKLPKDDKWSPRGWIYAYDLPLEKYASPFIFRRGVLRMSGNGEFRGTFDQQDFKLYYNVHHLKIENENLLIEAKDLRSDIPGQMMGFHQMDLNTYNHHGSLPIKQANYFEKNSGLKFSDINCTFLFDNETLTINPIETYCHGVFLAGRIFLDYSDPAPGVFSVEIDVPQMSGTVSQVQFILSHLKHASFLNDLPLKGFLNSRENGMQLSFDFLPQDYNLQAEVKTALADGCLAYDEAELALHGLYMDIDYHHQSRSIEISDIQGTLLVGKPTKAEEYLFGGNYVRLNDLERQDIQVDLWIKDLSKELLRIHAYTYEKEPGFKELVLNPNSHISNIYPDSFFCRFKNWFDCDSFSFKSNFELAEFFQDLTQFKQTGLYCFSHSFLNKLAQFDLLNGKIALNIHFDPISQNFHFFIDGKELKGISTDPHHCLIKGHKLDKKWVIDHLQWDDITAHAELQPEQGYLKIPFLGLNDGHSLLMGLEGDLFLEENFMRSKINLFEISLSDLQQWPSFSELITKWQPEGKLRATGDLKIEFLSQSPWLKIDADLLADLPSLICNQRPFYFLKPFHMHYKTGDSILFEQLYFNFDPDTIRNQIAIPLLNYNFDHEHIYCPQLNFQIPAHQMESLGQCMNRLVPDLINDQFKGTLINLKSEGEFKGSLSYEKHKAGSQFFIKLEDGSYNFNQQTYDLKNTEISQANHTVHFSTFSNEERCPYHVQGILNWPGLNSGELTFTDLLTNKNLIYPPLNLKFVRENSDKISIQSLQGYFCGMHLNLKNISADAIEPEITHLQGKIDFDINLITPLLSPPLVQQIKDLELGSMFSLHGNYAYNHQLVGRSFLDQVYFTGKLSAQEAIFKGFRFQEFFANINYQPNEIKINDLNIEDRAIGVEAKEISLKYNERYDAWWFNSPLFVVKNFRPYLLRNMLDYDPGFTSKYKTFLIKRLDLQNISGKISDTQSWQAKGNFHFLNSAQKNISHPLLAIPAEIILRLGLNPQVLNPVSGTIFFDMRGDYFYLTRFKDVYSEGRGSKFYLAESSNPSWIDLKGNVNIQIKMKQYNLLFKLAELFTVSMEGNIKKPKFYLQKHKPARKIQKTPFLINNSGTGKKYKLVGE